MLTTGLCCQVGFAGLYSLVLITHPAELRVCVFFALIQAASYYSYRGLEVSRSELSKVAHISLIPEGIHFSRVVLPA